LTDTNKWADEDHKWMIIEERKYMWNPEQIDRLASSMGLSHGMTVADIGCGLGYLGWTYWKYFGEGGKYIGVDYSDALIEEAREMSSKWSINGTARFLTGSCYDVPLPDESVDAAMCQALLMHLEYPERALQEMVRITKPGGIVMCKELDSISRYLRLGYSSASENDSIEDIIFQRRMKLIWIRGRKELGLGDYGIGARIPRMMHESGLEEIKGFCRDKLEFLVPPYKKPEQRKRIEIIERFSGESTQEEKKKAKDEYRKYYLAGGGDPASFDKDYSKMVELSRKERERRYEQLSAGTLFSCSGGSNFFCIFGKKPSNSVS
jgi:ubiquinone/menaquinone biosynthesis C-methylase UbiE